MGTAEYSAAAAGSEAALHPLERLLAERRWLLSELRRFEERYGMSTREFVEAWRSGRIPEPEDVEVLEDFMSWETLYEALLRVEARIRAVGRRAWLKA